MPSMATWKAAVVLIALAMPARGTSIVALADGGSIVITADDLRTNESAEYHVCKMRIACGRVVAVAGLSTSRLDALDVGEHAACTAPTIEGDGFSALPPRARRRVHDAVS